jgi:hypothetical protein
MVGTRHIDRRRIAVRRQVVDEFDLEHVARLDPECWSRDAAVVARIESR